VKSFVSETSQICIMPSDRQRLPSHSTTVLVLLSATATRRLLPSPHLCYRFPTSLSSFAASCSATLLSFVHSLRSCLGLPLSRSHRLPALAASIYHPRHVRTVLIGRDFYGVLGRKHRKIGPGLCGYGTYTRRILSSRPR
jgi:hypothetical protein